MMEVDSCRIDASSALKTYYDNKIIEAAASLADKTKNVQRMQKQALELSVCSKFLVVVV